MALCHSELFVGLAVIVNDWDSLSSDAQGTTLSEEEQPRPTQAEKRASQPRAAGKSCAVAYPPPTPSSLAVVAENIWLRMSFTLKEKLRSVCVELLRKTESQPDEADRGRKEDEADMLD